MIVYQTDRQTDRCNNESQHAVTNGNRFTSVREQMNELKLIEQTHVNM